MSEKEQKNIFNDMKISDHLYLTIEDWIFMLQECEKPVGESTPAMKKALELYRSEFNPIK